MNHWINEHLVLLAIKFNWISLTPINQIDEFN